MDQSANAMHVKESGIVSTSQTVERISVVDNIVNLSDLLTKVSIEDQSAFELLYEKTVPNVYGLAMKITGDTTTAEEVVGDVYFQVWEQADRYNGARSSVLAWLMMITRSRSLDAIRKSAKEKALPLEGVESVSQTAEDAENLLMQMDQCAEIRKALSQVGSVQRQLIALNFFRGYSHQELSDFTGIPLGTVKSHLTRAMKIMRKYLDESGVRAGAVK